MAHQKVSRLAPATLAGLAATLDKAVTAFVSTRHQRDHSGPDDRRLMDRADQAARYFDTLSLEGFFPEPGQITPVETRGPTGAYRSLSWTSTHEPCCTGLESDYRGHHENRQCHVRLYGGQRPRPVAILVHGYLGGTYGLEQRVWPLRWLDQLGFDAVLFTLPFHGMRASPTQAPLFPQSDIRFTAEGFRQSVTDLRDLVHWLRHRGHREVGLMGMSLGGYISALTATLEGELSFLVPMVPLACLVEFAREQGRFPRGTHQALRYQETLKRAYRLVSPLSRPQKLAPERVLVVAGKADRITPPHHARILARHFSAPLEAWPGGHLLQFGRTRSLQRVGRFLREVSHLSF